MDNIALPKHSFLGVEQPNITVLEWYLACLHPNEYDTLQIEKDKGLHLVDPIRGAENRIRITPSNSYMQTLEVVSDCLPHFYKMTHTAAAWLFKLEPTLIKEVTRHFKGEDTSSLQNWSYDKHIGFALVCAQAMAKNWGNPSLTNYWRGFINHDNNTTREKTNDAIAKIYIKTLAQISEKWQPVTLNGFLSRIPERHQADAERSLNSTALILEARNDPFAERFNELLNTHGPVLVR